jgi:hypothetical protein
MAATFIALRATSPRSPNDPLENGRFAAHIGAMTEGPEFRSKMVRSGRWTVTIVTGYGPSSYVGDFATEEEADHWISINSKDWPHPAVKPK